MKNLKNTVAALGLMATLGFGAVSANAGLMISDRSSNGQQPCGAVKNGILNQLAGILIVGAPVLEGVIIFGRDGLMISDRQNCESSKNGLMISDRNGLMISD